MRMVRNGVRIDTLRIPVRVVQARRIGIVTPLVYVAAHIEETPFIWTLLTYGVNPSGVPGFTEPSYI